MSKGKPYRLYHMSPGLTQYTNPETGEDYNVLVKKETLDRMNPSFVGLPIFNQHKSVEVDEAFDFKNGAAEDLAAGVVTKAGYDDVSGMFFVDAMIWDEETQALAANDYGVSNAYRVDEVSPGGLYNNVPYEEEVTKASYLHLAIVKDPRYSGTKILQNTKANKGGLVMKFKLFSKKAETPKEDVKKNENQVEDMKDTMEVDASSTFEVDGKSIPLSAMVEAYEAQNQVEEVPSLSPEDTVTIGDKEVTVQDLYDAYVASQAESPVENAATENSKDSETTSPSAPSKESVENSKDETQPVPTNNHFKVVKNAAQKDPEDSKKVLNTSLNRQRRGKTLYGTIKEKE